MVVVRESEVLVWMHRCRQMDDDERDDDDVDAGVGVGVDDDDGGDDEAVDVVEWVSCVEL